jgi:tRNA nucleotidyltransferase/poly(A) polymerase
VRFTNRFEFTPVPELLDAAMNPAIREGLLEKASFERMGVELDKMLEGNNAHLSI